MPDGYVQAFAKMDRLILTEKLDGQNNCFSSKGVFARSHTSASVHPWDKPLIDRWHLIKNDLKNLEIFGENMYGVHSIEYSKLESFFYVFAVRDGDVWLSWEEVKFYAAMLDLPTVPEIAITNPLKDMYTSEADENTLLDRWLTSNLGMNWTESVDTAGLLGGSDTTTGKPCSEGFVIRNADSFTTNGGGLNVASNEFNNLFKLVRKSHVKTDVHWTKTWRAATLIDYDRYKWLGYQYINRV